MGIAIYGGNVAPRFQRRIVKLEKWIKMRPLFAQRVEQKLLGIVHRFCHLHPTFFHLTLWILGSLAASAMKRERRMEGNMNDVVNHPAHYTDGKIEVIDFIEDKGLNFHRGNAVKYIARAGKKDPEKEVEDLRKAVWYLNREITRLTGENPNAALISEIIEQVERAVDKARLDNEFDNTEGKWFIDEGDFIVDLNDEIDVVRRKYKVALKGRHPRRSDTH